MRYQTLLYRLWSHRDKLNKELLKERFDAFTRMFPLAVKGEYPAKKRNLVLGIASLLYVISPIDILPEIALGPFGLLDDFAILAFGFRMLDKEITNFLNWEEQQKNIYLN